MALIISWKGFSQWFEVEESKEPGAPLLDPSQIMTSLNSSMEGQSSHLMNGLYTNRMSRQDEATSEWAH